MIDAFFFLARRTLRNRLLSRLRRLRNPRYLVFALVGAAYFWFFALRHWVHGIGFAAGQGAGAILPAGLAEVAGSIAILVVITIAWCGTVPRAALPFTEPEIQFLFPAPIARRSLVRWKLMRSELGLLFTVAIVSAVAWPLVARANVVLFVAGIWIVFETMRLHLTGIRIARYRLDRHGVGWMSRTAFVIVVAIAVFGAAGWWALTTAGPPPSPGEDAESGLVMLSTWAESLASSGPVWLLLLPGRLLVRPALADGPLAFAVALGPALILMLANDRWVVGAGVALEEGAIEEAQHREARRRSHAERRAGRAHGYTRVRPPFELGPVGRPETALIWKNLVQILRGLGVRGSARLLILLVAVAAMMAGFARRNVTLGIVAGSACALLALVLFLVGPRLLRGDFSQELAYIDILRSLPITGRSLVIGTLMGPVLVLSVLQWALLAGFLVMAGHELDAMGQVAVGSVPLTLTAALLLPPMNLVTALLQNAAVVLLPAWVVIGPTKGGGIEVFGQRIVTGVGRLLIMAISLLPAAAAFGLLLFLGTLVTSFAVAVPLAAAGAAIVLCAEAVVGILALGSFLDRFDPSSELDALRS